MIGARAILIQEEHVMGTAIVSLDFTWRSRQPSGKL